MTLGSPSPRLRNALAAGPALLVPGVYDALSAVLVQQAGFPAAYLSGASLAYTQLGAPDLGLVSLDHLVDVVSRIRERVDLPLIVDADTGFGNALNVQRTVRLLERAGANAIQIEDQSFPKRCGHLAGKGVIGAEEMAGKIKAAAEARRHADTLIIGRTDAIAVEGLDSATERAELYLEAGADILFIEAPRSLAEMQHIVDRFARRAPLIANMVEGGETPGLSRDDLGALGFKLVIAPGALVRVLIPAFEAFLESLMSNGSSRAFAEKMTNLAGVNQRVGLSELIKIGQRYDAALKSAG